MTRHRKQHGSNKAHLLVVSEAEGGKDHMVDRSRGSSVKTKGLTNY